MKSQILYRFKSETDRQTIQFQGESLKVSELKKLIVKKKNLNPNTEKELVILTDQTQKELNDNELLSTNSSVIIERRKPSIIMNVPISVSFCEICRKEPRERFITQCCSKMVCSTGHESKLKTADNKCCLCGRQTPFVDEELAGILNNARFFIIKSFNNENIETARKKNEWSTTVTNQKKLKEAFEKSPNVILIFSINKSSKFQGFARMEENITINESPFWTNSENIKLGGVFKIRWLRFNELSFSRINHLKNPLNSNEPIKKSRDTQELPNDIGRQICSMFEPDPPSKKEEPIRHPINLNNPVIHVNNNAQAEEKNTVKSLSPKEIEKAPEKISQPCGFYDDLNLDHREIVNYDDSEKEDEEEENEKSSEKSQTRVSESKHQSSPLVSQSSQTDKAPEQDPIEIEEEQKAPELDCKSNSSSGNTNNQQIPSQFQPPLPKNIPPPQGLLPGPNLLYPQTVPPLSFVARPPYHMPFPPYQPPYPYPPMGFGMGMGMGMMQQAPNSWFYPPMGNSSRVPLPGFPDAMPVNPKDAGQSKSDEIGEKTKASKSEDSKDQKKKSDKTKKIKKEKKKKKEKSHKEHHKKDKK